MDHTHFARRPLGLQGPIFPQEILDQIMSSVDDRQTLHSCLLASPALLAGARRGIFRKVTMRPWQHGFAQEFFSVSYRASCVRHLTIEGSLNSLPDTPFTVELLSSFNKLESISIARLVRWEPVSIFPIQSSSVESLTIAESHLPSFLDVVQMICSYPRLTTLCVRETFWDDSDSTEEFLKTACLPAIRELDVWSVDSSLARIWLLRGVDVQLQKLYARAATYTDALMWIEMVERAGHHLIDLTIIDDNLSFFPGVPFNLQQNRNLRTLRFSGPGHFRESQWISTSLKTLPSDHLEVVHFLNIQHTSFINSPSQLDNIDEVLARSTSLGDVTIHILMANGTSDQTIEAVTRNVERDTEIFMPRLTARGIISIVVNKEAHSI